MNSYEKLKKIQQNKNSIVMTTALTYLLDIGCKSAMQITDKMIDEVEGNGLMTKEFVQELMRTAREIAQAADTPSDIYVFCQAEEIFDVRYNANKLPRYKLEDMIKHRIDWEDCIRTDTSDYIRYLCNRYDCDAEDLELLGYTIPEDYWEGDE